MARTSGQTFEKILLFERAVVDWHQLPRKVVGSQSLGAFKNRGDVMLRDMVSRHGGDSLIVGLRDLFQS